jgi:hypothetical protein
MYCQTEKELELLEKLQKQFPEQQELLLELIAWVYLNKPERFEQIMQDHKERGKELIDLGEMDYSTILQRQDI